MAILDRVIGTSVQTGPKALDGVIARALSARQYSRSGRERAPVGIGPHGLRLCRVRRNHRRLEFCPAAP